MESWREVLLAPDATLKRAIEVSPGAEWGRFCMCKRIRISCSLWCH